MRRFASAHSQMKESKQDFCLRKPPYFWKAPSCNSSLLLLESQHSFRMPLSLRDHLSRIESGQRRRNWNGSNLDRNTTQSETTGTFNPRSFINSSSKRTWGPCGNTWNTDQELNKNAPKKHRIPNNYTTRITKTCLVPEIHILDHSASRTHRLRSCPPGCS